MENLDDVQRKVDEICLKIKNRLKLCSNYDCGMATFNYKVDIISFMTYSANQIPQLEKAMHVINENFTWLNDQDLTDIEQKQETLVGGRRHNLRLNWEYSEKLSNSLEMIYSIEKNLDYRWIMLDLPIKKDGIITKLRNFIQGL